MPAARRYQCETVASLPDLTHSLPPPPDILSGFLTTNNSTVESSWNIRIGNSSLSPDTMRVASALNLPTKTRGEPTCRKSGTWLKSTSLGLKVRRFYCTYVQTKARTLQELTRLSRSFA